METIFLNMLFFFFLTLLLGDESFKLFTFGRRSVTFLCFIKFVIVS